MKNFFSKFTFLKSKGIRNKVLFTLGMIVLYRFLASVPPLGIDPEAFTQAFENNPLAPIFAFTGGSLANPSLVMIGLGAYINASIILQLLTTVIPKLEEISKEGQRGRKIIGQYTRYLTIPLSIMQAIVIYVFLANNAATSNLVPSEVNLDVISFIFTVTAGSLVLMWIGELITEYGIGNGSSILITYSIISALPALITVDFAGLSSTLNNLFAGQLTLGQFFATQDAAILLFLVFGLSALVAIIVYVNEGIRKIKIQYARRTIGNQANYLPLRINQAGVMPIIFATALMAFPGIVTQLLVGVVEPGTNFYDFLTQVNEYAFSSFNTPAYNAILFFMIIGFTYFYNFVIQKPSETAENLQKGGAFIPGIRPGPATDKYIKQVMYRLTFVGSIFLGILAILPAIAGYFIYPDSSLSTGQFGILSGLGGTSLLIIVSVFLTTYRQMQSMQATKSYDSFR